MTRQMFPRILPRERAVLADTLRTETTGGLLLLAATVVALVWANSPWQDGYHHLRELPLGPLTVEAWASDGALAIFFYLAGLELKRELVVGSLSKLSEAVLPVAAAISGMVLPAIIYLGVNLLADDGKPHGWAVPTATDIAFALAVLAIVGSHLPNALRAFLLTLAVVDDFGAILVIAVFFSHGFHLWSLLASVALIAVWYVLQRRNIRTPFLYVPIAIAAWWFMHESGVHATIAGVALGLVTRVESAERIDDRLRPWSAGVAVPVFALFAAGVTLSGDAVRQLLTDPVAIGIAAGLLAGKALGVFGGSWLTARFTRAELNSDLAWRDVGAVSVLAGIGFTVALLIAQLAFAGDVAQVERAKAAVLIASVLAALIASALLLRRNRSYAR
ncbi:Na+/H+ antiporter NhaA [Kribbella sandramycini]|uniref:Na(+)/H(+) antiporter NhaA n=1 Tax=Kribbella sandramycini TaxID=60450 RepID=A0A7Y4P2Q4_9ACTN|nr:Na+/H+ antiporter NhaA [Kribbella sandramycini]MBB6566020.1 NhaA family Na+:H+ antiporter [Kribbella sandramycini]NOL45021.1 Na+/H+ antiporter NhaA [Kribbella sandramycini]